MWNCVQVEDDDRIRRKIIFNQVQPNPQLLRFFTEFFRLLKQMIDSVMIVKLTSI